MLSYLGGITLLGMLLATRWKTSAPVLMWAVSAALMAAYAWGVGL